ncbi:hypothetical protein K488DRAFT_59514 [Vararia minispora EC-137]|uniref:Uncharacterized protein n=1 Tax=Vararia minispora EC-137 TaxID=1314806 RepID=A0ACB8Q8I7_9AGAM|nr:hypothetical protein K488DRAFT_59514 [Vararia minispora EC-137]
MRTSFLLRRAPRPSLAARRALLSSSNPASFPRKPPENTRPVRESKRSASSKSSVAPGPTPPPNEDSGGGSSSPNDPSKSENPLDQSRNTHEPESDVTKIPVPVHTFSTVPDSVFWTAESLAENPPPASSLPPPQILEEALNNLYISLQPRTQARATYSTNAEPAVEPTLALYCPIEGGDYIVDDTVRELARRSGSDVVVLDAAHMAAGEWGMFGQAGQYLNFPKNPLHFPSSRSSLREEEDEEDVEGETGSPGPVMALQLVQHPMLQRRIPSTKSSSPSTPGSGSSRLFFDVIVNRSIPAREPDSNGTTKPRRPRIIYVRDFPTLAPSAASWYPPLVSVVRNRRQGVLVDSNNVENPAVIIFGITPSLINQNPPVSAYVPNGGSTFNMALGSQRDQASTPRPSSSKTQILQDEDEAADKVRERRLRERLRKWERNDSALLEELPRLEFEDIDGSASSPARARVMFIKDLSSILPALTGLPHGGPRTQPQIHAETDTGYFRTSILVPEIRSPAKEKETRMARRREINQLVMKMGVGAVGGRLSGDYTPRMVPATDDGENLVEDDMWEEWGRRFKPWVSVRRIADQVVGSASASWILANAVTEGKRPMPMNLFPVSWESVRYAWDVQRSLRDVRKAWVKSAGRNEEQDEEDQKEEEDSVAEQVKHDPDLDPHEQRLLGCIVNPATMTTTFEQVHLPPRTIDSVRTIASLPLLHPHAFKHGILKEHGMTGCLLFGPPGTGKTLVVRALAKEAGTRMMVITPSDVMDMYVGEGEKLVKSVFSLARRLAPCIIFIDEIDALFGARSTARETGGAMAHRGVITEFMQEMDGLRTSRSDRVIVIGATNRPFDLDDAVLRRLPRRLLVDLPGEKEREEILKILLRDEALGPDVDLNELAKGTVSFSGSDLKHLAVAAALDAVKQSVKLPWMTEQPASTSEGIEEPVLATASSVVSSEAFPKESANPPTNETRVVDEDETGGADHLAAGGRVLHLHNFEKALKEITPSSSEHLGTLADIRRWNEEFGEGRRSRRKQVWGKDRFGFTNRWAAEEDGRVVTQEQVQAVGGP